MTDHIRTSTLILISGVPRTTLAQWIHLNRLKHAPRGKRGQGRGNESMWSPEAVAEVMRRVKSGARQGRPWRSTQ